MPEALVNGDGVRAIPWEPREGDAWPAQVRWPQNRMVYPGQGGDIGDWPQAAERDGLNQIIAVANYHAGEHLADYLGPEEHFSVTRMQSTLDAIQTARARNGLAPYPFTGAPLAWPLTHQDVAEMRNAINWTGGDLVLLVKFDEDGHFYGWCYNMSLGGLHTAYPSQPFNSATYNAIHAASTNVGTSGIEYIVGWHCLHPSLSYGYDYSSVVEHCQHNDMTTFHAGQVAPDYAQSREKRRSLWGYVGQTVKLFNGAARPLSVKYGEGNGFGDLGTGFVEVYDLAGAAVLRKMAQKTLDNQSAPMASQSYVSCEYSSSAGLSVLLEGYLLPVLGSVEALAMVRMGVGWYEPPGDIDGADLWGVTYVQNDLTASIEDLLRSNGDLFYQWWVVDHPKRKKFDLKLVRHDPQL